MKRTSLVLTLLLTLILVGCTATPLPTLVATASTEELPTPVMTGTPVETLLPTPTLTIPVPTATLTISPLPSLPIETPTIVSTHTVPFAPGSVIFTQTPKSNLSEPGPGLEIVNNLFLALPGSQPDNWTIQPLPIGLISKIYPSSNGGVLAMRVSESEFVHKMYLFNLQDHLLTPVNGSEKFNDLSWLPDQQGIIYADDTNLLLINTDGLFLEALTNNPPNPIEGEPYNYISHVQVSPDGQSIALIVIQSVGLPDNRFMEVSTDVMLFNLNQRQFVKLAENVGRNFVNFKWSFDGQSLVFSRENYKGLFVLDVNTLDLITLGSEQQFYFSNWSPDGYSLAYTQNTSLFIWDTETRTEKELFNADYISEPFWSPDGKYVAAGYRVGEYAGILMIAPASTEQRDYQLGFSVDWVRWSPDSNWLIYPSGTALNILSIEDGGTHLLLPPNEGMTLPNSVFWLPVSED